MNKSWDFIFFALLVVLTATFATSPRDAHAGWKTKGAIFLGAWGVKKAIKSPKARGAAINYAKKHPEFKDSLVDAVEKYIVTKGISPKQAQKARAYLKQITDATGGKSTTKNKLPEARAGPDLNKFKVELPRSKYPESAKHVEEAIKQGHPKVLTKQTSNGAAAKNRRESLKGIPTKKGMDRDEYPPAMTKEGGKGSSVKHIKSSDNRGSGSCIGKQCRNLKDGDEFYIEIVD